MIQTLIRIMSGLAAWAISIALADDSVTCNNRIVERGDHVSEVYAACGEPTWKDRYEELVTIGVKDKETEPRRLDFPAQHVVITREDWVYNDGPTRLLRNLTFEEGRLVYINVGGYGFHPEGVSGRCNTDDLRKGMSKLELELRCGEPVYKNHRTQIISHGNGNVRREQNVRVEEWTYDFGSTKFMRIVVMERNVVVKVENADRGR